MKPKFEHYALALITPEFNSSLATLVMTLEHLKKKEWIGTTPRNIFYQVKNIFHIIESISSARIEGNHTTIIEYVDSKIDPAYKKTEGIDEIRNMEEALSFIDDCIEKTKIDKLFLSELHKKVVKGLNKEGSKTPGIYRQGNIKIAHSLHIPPDYTQVENYMEELLNFINKKDVPQYDLIKTAIAHHRFVWVHPFDNGNGRTGRLLTYAMLAKQGFRIHCGRMINPAAVFCEARVKYNEKLAGCDKGDVKGILAWSEYVLKGLKREVEKIDRLMDYEYLKDKILLPALKFSLDREHITNREYKILNLAIEKVDGFKNRDLRKVFPSKLSSDISRLIRKLKERKMIMPLPNKKEKYMISFDNNFLLRGIINSLGNAGFLPIKEDA
ncbi:MAG: Fic family protein [Candidatus Pacebacteria bacterium]|nr:Fic family protein [Candidatus Paceibacterota bacterium]